MRKVVVAEFVSLDGVMEAPDQWQLENDLQDILLLGSADLVNSLMPHRVIDEYRLWVHPVVVAKGKRLFKDGIDETVLRLVDTKTFDSGVVAVNYQPAAKEAAGGG